MVQSIFFNPWIWVIPIILTTLITLFIFCVTSERNDYFGSFWKTPTTVLSGMVTLPLAVAYFSAVLPPYDGTFYQTYRITGTVSEIKAAFTDATGTASDTFISRVEGVDLYISSSDQRFRTVSLGDSVNLLCNKEFAYFQQPWYNCSFAG